MKSTSPSKVWRPNDEPHPTVPGATVCMIENVFTKHGKVRHERHREAVMKFPDGGWITVSAHPSTGNLGIASYHNGADRVDVLNAMIDEQAAWLESVRRPRKIAA